ncbi:MULTISPECIES: hypothetical protein [Lysinibacillus]|jgi:FtsZ-binding cell division protein ZapB|uniref:Translation initiation factor 2 n=1 Tax=Lysinibacillus fusiformis TaxID=28031 RepID=A0A2I0UZU6_9BACI|nr:MULTISPECIES: hypothetical protein [Lysinibacillus]PKU51593.1 hypothetical protein CRI88_12910 [Lysinibacillus fusiformis]WCH45873.1 hypothetical protein NV349_12230 [Lysinibacillus sp. OF-1]SCY37036.1 hypothetical protein SAMN02787078_01370 [Lysinibacillus sp. SG9]SDB18406.1 hypothetical protein SAMN02787079_01372 [Lysinibacillus sp. TC-37]SFS66306.1 hypothetical protein SAMN02787087_01377 [Lysinibacillus sp. SG55]
MKNNKGYRNSEGIESVSQAAKLAVIAGAITTLGDAIATIAAGLALEDELKENESNSNDIDKLQKQIDELNYELKQLKRMLR